MDEHSPLESTPELRGDYTRSKLRAERAVLDAVADRGLVATVLRPGVVFGGPISPDDLAVALGRFGRYDIVLGDGTATVPLVHVDDVASAVVSAIRSEDEASSVVQLVDPDAPTQSELLQLLHPDSTVVRVPRTIALAGGALSVPLLERVGRSSPLHPHRLRAGMARMRFRSTEAEATLLWSPGKPLAERLRESMTGSR